MQCTPCRKGGIDRDGGENAHCWKHRRTKCGLCQELSNGMELCVDCQIKVEIRRSISFENLIFPKAQNDYRAILGEEALQQARFQTYAAIDSLFRILGITLKFVSHPPDEEERFENRRQMEFHFTNVA